MFNLKNSGKKIVKLGLFFDIYLNEINVVSVVIDVWQ